MPEKIKSEIWLKTRDLCRYFRGGPQQIKAVNEVNLSLAEGEFLGIVGASGSGKSTLLSLMAGLDTPTSGHIEVDGVSLSSLNRRELASYRARKVGMVFQSFNLIYHYTALKNVELALYFNNTPGAERRAKAVEILNYLGLADRLDHRPSDLSGGEQQRVAIARALVKNPVILFADEPTGNLDYENSRLIGDLLSDLNRGGLTIVMATHDIEFAERCCNRIIRMHYGQIADGESRPPEERKLS